MAKTLTAVTLSAPAAPVNASVGNTFTFTATPTLAGTGGVNRYDLKFEVNGGAGYATIAATGLTTANTNPATNLNANGATSITVTCATAGNYTIRISGAPTTGGAYTLTSGTQTVAVTLAGITGTMAAAEGGSDVYAASGTVAVTGSLDATEAGADVSAVTGVVAISGSFAVPESGSDIFTASGSVGAVSGILSVSEIGIDVFSGSGSIIVSGALAALETGTDFLEAYIECLSNMADAPSYKSANCEWNNTSHPWKAKPASTDDPAYSKGHPWCDPRLPWNDPANP